MDQMSIFQTLGFVVYVSIVFGFFAWVAYLKFSK